ncbi:MAG: hypothetical protein M3R72_10895 [Bacteroidota bacterium]|nr:hypothetical protein [Bacteroidota bacterium]
MEQAKRLFIDVINDSALAELKAMENENKIKILNHDELLRLKEKRTQIWEELEHYTYENILKTVKKSAQ